MTWEINGVIRVVSRKKETSLHTEVPSEPQPLPLSSYSRGIKERQDNGQMDGYSFFRPSPSLDLCSQKASS